jgi:polyhydroxyalkanoate synthase
LTSGGHIAGIINHPDKSKREYWINDNNTSDPELWLQEAANHKGSWWEDWIPWLEEYSGKKITPPSVGSEQYVPIISAPGTYVLES